MRSYACLPDLTALSGDSVDKIMNELADAMNDFRGSWAINMKMIGPRRRDTWRLVRDKKNCTASRSDSKKESYDLELVAKDTVWRKIASGRLSPITALLEGSLLVRGDTKLATAALGHLRARGDIYDVCHPGE